MFAFSTVLGWHFFAEQAYRFLFPDGAGITVYRLLYLGAVFLGPFLTPELAWHGADFAKQLDSVDVLHKIFSHLIVKLSFPHLMRAL